MERDMEKLSALMDGELSPADAGTARAALAGEDAQAQWQLWLAIGAALRQGADEVAPAPGFAERLAARLDASDAPTPAAEALP
jgi:negative regulator of sigma E activity